ncbi:type II secretion system protein GspC [uncultured Desulfuromonas sp.]|uniref:type II secretion system protein GspC n=1 Tax=uncultured Desulfuromonas sp. TaxID=181013 RepID=UPI0026130DD9|nr:type II secretion system protein GspC [uncultured Desulfuromonas sp.]
MLPFLQRYSTWFYLLLAGLLGICLGHLAATVLGTYLTPPLLSGEETAQVRTAPERKPALAEYEVVLQRNIFDSTARPNRTLATEQKPKQKAAKPAQARVDLKLVGTVAAGENSLALLMGNRETASYRLRDKLPGGGKLEEITRSLVRIKNSDGTEETLHLYEEESPEAPAATARPGRPGSSSKAATTTTGGYKIIPAGENRWIIPKEEAEKARTNIGELLKQARMEPNIINGQTEGFTVRMLRPRSLLAGLGIKRGDILKQINGVELNSPEKALQIFQQLREAKHLSIGLQRSGQNLNFEYDVQ